MQELHKTAKIDARTDLLDDPFLRADCIPILKFVYGEIYLRDRLLVLYLAEGVHHPRVVV